MSPTLLREGQFRVFFFSREEERMHVHVAHPHGELKFWLMPQLELAINFGLSATEARKAQMIVEAHIQEIRNAWYQHFAN